MNGETELLTTEIRPPLWPEPGDKLFVPGQGRTTAHIGYHRSFSVFAIAYKDAADALIDSIVEKDCGADLQFYPIAYLYRHYLELRLKHLLISGGMVVHNESKLEHSHDLKRLWMSVRKILDSLSPGVYEAEMNALGSCIDEVCSLDSESMSFRYPETKKGMPTLQQLVQVDLLNLKNVMDRVASFLDCASDFVGDILDNMPREEDYY